MKTLVREEVIEELTNNTVNTINNCIEQEDLYYVHQLLRNGHKGFATYSNEELSEEYAEIFGEEVEVVD